VNHLVTQHSHLKFIHGRGVQSILTHAKADEMVTSDHLLLLVLSQVCTDTVGDAFLGPDRVKPHTHLRGLGFEICVPPHGSVEYALCFNATWQDHPMFISGVIPDTFQCTFGFFLIKQRPILQYHRKPCVRARRTLWTAMAAATARPLLPSILKVQKRDRESCNDGAFTIDSILAEPTLEKVLPPLLACTAVDCEVFQQQQKGQESSSNDETVHKKPRLDTTCPITTQTDVNQGILNSLHTMDNKIQCMDKKIQSMDGIMQGMQKALKSHEHIMKAIIDSVSLLQSSKVPEPQKPETAPVALWRESALTSRDTTPRHSGSSSIQKQDKDTALASDPPANESGSLLEVLAGVAVDQLKGTRVRWAEPLHDTSKHDSAPTEASEDAPVQPSDQIGAFTSDFTIIDYETPRPPQPKARIVVWMNSNKSTYAIHDNVVQAKKKTSETQSSIYKALNQDKTGNKTWFYLEDCLFCLCASTSANQHKMAYEIAKQRIVRFKIHWHGHSHIQDTWETFDNVNFLAVVEFFRDRSGMQSIIDHEPKAVSWRKTMQNKQTKYKVVDHENFLQPKSATSMTYWVTCEKLTADLQQYLHTYYAVK
tara:strand:+ start:1846 stop:3627 length:1782 start_codon:yes stop_codon:yes gene_type:complete